MKKYAIVIGAGCAILAVAYLLTSHHYPIRTTSISIITDYFDPQFTGSTAVLEEALKTIQSECDHIFMNKQLWLECIKDDLEEATFIPTWQVYDTHIGLLYFKKKSFTENMGIKIDTFSHITNPFDTIQIKQIKDGLWPQQFPNLFDLNAWKTYHSNPKSKSMIYMNGHGTRRIGKLDLELASGMRATLFATLLQFFNDKLCIDLIGIQSCFWTTKRIYELMQQYGYLTLNFTLLTPMSIEKGLWLDTINNYLNKKKNICCFFDCCRNLTQCFKNQITDEIRDIINNTDTLQLTLNKGQHATIMTAGTNQIVMV